MPGSATRSSSTSSSSTTRKGNKDKGIKDMKEGWSCKSCQKVFKGEDDKIVQCEYCTFYYCNQCLKLSDDDYEHFKSPALHWFCAACETKVMKNLRTDHEVEARCAKFLEAMEGRVSKLEEQIKNKVDESKVKDLIQELASSTDTNEAAAKVVESVNQKVSDLRDSALREKNIIIFGAAESEADEGKDRQVEDTNFVNSLFDFLDSDNNNVKKVTRLGRRRKEDENSDSTDTQNDLKPRPIRVILKDAEAKQELLKKLSKLKSLDESDPLKKLSITQDMSKSEREANKLKLQEAKDLNEKDNSGKFKYIVRGPPWERRVVKVQRT